ncbi:MAG: hypothetical protein LBG15_03820 [Dysgonamonadaceae bacterium]|jgi:hypothetical protein|nr:hypothetical protein [Dysgonamonadaceae bacterium]
MISLIILACLFIAYIIFLWVTQPKSMKYKVIFAGKRNNYEGATIKSAKDISKLAITDQLENKVNSADYQKYIVVGNSMLIAGIREDDLVLVDDKVIDYKNIKANNVIAIKYDIDNDESDLKLRKKIACIDFQENFDEWFNNLTKHYTIQADKEYIKEKYNKCIEKHISLINDNKNVTFLFSSTFHTDKNEIDYSFHPAKSLFGVIKYVIKGN